MQVSVAEQEGSAQVLPVVQVVCVEERREGREGGTPCQ